MRQRHRVDTLKRELEKREPGSWLFVYHEPMNESGRQYWIDELGRGDMHFMTDEEYQQLCDRHPRVITFEYELIQ